MQTDLLDELGEWSQIKHEILEKYAHAYTTIVRSAFRKMDLVWGDRTWQSECYEEIPTLFEPRIRKLPNEAIAEAFRRRLQSVAGFKYVPSPIAMKNSTNATVYYLYFASPNKTGAHIVGQIFSKYGR